MKKAVLSLLAIGILAGGAAAQSAEKNLAISLNAGVLADNDGFKTSVQATVDARAGIRLGRHLQLSPEVMYAFLSGESMLCPGVILNYMGRNVFLGAGPVALFHDASSGGDSFWGVKFNIGYARGHIIATAYFTGALYTDEYVGVFGNNQIGATIGYRF